MRVHSKPYEAEVRAYIAYCRHLGDQIKPAYHPTANGAVKLIPHGGDKDQASQIRRIFASLSEPEAAR